MVRHVNINVMLERYAKLMEDPLLFEEEREEGMAELFEDLGPAYLELIKGLYSVRSTHA